MTLLDSQAPKPATGIGKYVPLPTLIILVVLVLLIGGLLGYRFRNYREERAVARFLTNLQQGQYREAYQLWQPSPSYTWADFLHDWGERGDYGKIREFQILRSRSKGSTTVIVSVRINGVDPPLDLLVDRKTKGLAYSIF